MRGDYKHWINVSIPGGVSFVTTTALDFNRVFDRDEMKDAMLRSLVSDCIHYGARLHAYVIMVHHIHAIFGCPPENDIRWLVQRIKANSAKRLGSLLTDQEKAGFNQQRGLNEHVFWQKSFRSLPMTSEERYFQKVRYIHLNPVRAELCAEAGEYPWSSAWLYERGLWNDETGLLLDALLATPRSPF